MRPQRWPLGMFSFVHWKTDMTLCSFWDTFSIGVSTVSSRYKSVSTSSFPRLILKPRNADMYTQAFPKDKISRKALVFTVYALETLQTAIVAHDAFVTYAAGFGDVTALLHVHLLWLGIPVLSGIG